MSTKTGQAHRVIDASYVRDYVVWIRFSDGVEGEVDLANELDGPVFEPLRDPRLVHRLARRDQPELDVAIDPPDVLAVEDGRRIEVAHLAAHLRIEAGRVEGLDPADPGAPGEETLPRRGDVVAERADGAHAGDDDAARAHLTSFPVRTVAAR